MRARSRAAPLPPAAEAEAAAGEKLRALQIRRRPHRACRATRASEEWLGGFATMIRLTDADAGAVRVVAEDGRHLRWSPPPWLPPEVAARAMPLDCGACGRALRDAAVNAGASALACATHTSQAWFGGFGGMIVVPLAHQGQVLGVYNLFLREARAIPAEVVLLYRSIGEHLGMALENARLARENLRMTVMNERQMMANEVHDSLAQTLATEDAAGAVLALRSDGASAR
jgi:two-component system nitrate/nitrite sensor histidine kinase NarX